MIEITKLSSKGQLVIPSRIREQLKLTEGLPLAISMNKEVILIKKINLNSLKKEFEALTKEGSALAKRQDIKDEEEVVRRIHKGRGKV